MARVRVRVRFVSCQVRFRFVSGSCQVHVRFVSGLFQVRVRFVSGSCQVPFTIKVKVRVSASVRGLLAKVSIGLGLG